MKLSFSIQNWNHLGWSDVCAAALDARLQGIELFDVDGPVFRGKSSPTNPELAAATRRHLTNQGLSLPCVDTVGDFTDPGFDRELSECVEVAVNLGIPNIGIHTSCESQAACAERIGRLLEAVAGKPVSLLVATTGAYADTANLRDLLNRFADDRLAALWDMHSTCVCGGEEAETTITNLGAYVRHVHIHDFRRENGVNVPELVGEGELPIRDLMNALRSVNYDGFLSIQWNPEWIDGLSDIEIILTHFASCMSRFESTRLNKKHHYWNRSHTGTFPCKKQTLIDKTFPQVLDTMVQEYPDQLAIKFTTLD
ncbi:MAG: TIM barrel protein, partial [Clostridia bacterium]|nr:TIM barrel protein [Clostridia bacterium]